MHAPVVAEAACPTLRLPREDVARGAFEGQPELQPADLLALSLVFGLPRAPLYSVLRGEPLALAQADGEARRGLADDVRKTGDAAKAGPNASDTPLDGVPVGPPVRDLEQVFARLGCPDPGALAAEARQEARAATAMALTKGAQAVTWGDARYPPLLGHIFDPPLVLWVLGSVESLSAPGIAIVGSRAASAYGEETATRLASDLASRGLVIVSGLARGIDAAAHRGALAAGGRTIGVLGCGVDVVYPPEHAELIRQVARSGAVISELPAGAAPQRMNFPRRNRIISGLSRAVVVVEARQRSGALITADCALEQGRDVMAVPGNVLCERHRGSHTLLKAGAALVETAADVLEALQMPAEAHRAAQPAGAADRLVGIMDVGESYTLDALVSMSGEDVSRLLPRLMALELQGLVTRLPGGRFGRVGGTC